MTRESGFSEVVGALIMIAVVMTGAALVGVFFLSEPPPEKIPHVNLEIGKEYRWDPGSSTYKTFLEIYHRGGDSLQIYLNGKDAENNSKIQFLVDNTYWNIVNDAPSDTTTIPSLNFSLKNQSSHLIKDYFSNGDNFEAEYLNKPRSVQMVFTRASGGKEITWTGGIPNNTDFHANSQSICLGDSVQLFDDSNFNPTQWHWDFGDGTYSTVQNPTHRYDQADDYSIILNASNNRFSAEERKEKYISVRPIFAEFTVSPSFKVKSGFEVNQNKYGKTITFSDASLCNPTSWSWNFGDGTTSTTQNPSHFFENEGNDVVRYPVSLNVANSRGTSNITKSVEILPPCDDIFAQIQQIDVNNYPEDGYAEVTVGANVKTTIPGAPDEEGTDKIVKLTWVFIKEADGSETIINGTPENVGTIIQKLDLGEDYLIKLWVFSDCNNKFKYVEAKVPVPDTVIFPDFSITPTTGLVPLEVNITDKSSPLENISRWYWSIDSSTVYDTTNVSKRNPKNHTYTTPGDKVVYLNIYNEAGRKFTVSKKITAYESSIISGKVWYDKNVNRVNDGGDSALQNWPVSLDHRISGSWDHVLTTTTDSSGYYQFSPQNITTEVFQVNLSPLQQNWKVTSSYGSYDDNQSSSLPVFAVRNYAGIDFGLTQLHTSSIQIPGKFTTFGRGTSTDGTFYYNSLGRAAQYLDYNTTYNTTPRIVMMNPVSTAGIFTLDPPGGYPNGYSKWGDSSYNLTFREYNNYLKYVGYGAYFLDWSKYNGVNFTYGINFPVPDNTALSASNFDIRYKWDPSIHFVIDKPKEGDTIPYTSDYTIEAHFEGLGEQTGQCDLLTPAVQDFLYNTTIAEYLVSHIDTRPYEGQTRLFTARMTLSSGKYNYTFSNATIGWEPIIATITNISSELPYNQTYKLVRGNATIKANISGKWQDNTSAILYVNGVQFPMTKTGVSGINTMIQTVLSVEPFAGKSFPIWVRVPYITGKGTFVDSPTWNISPLSKLPIQANFSADPWSGPAPLETSFTDLSIGAPKTWLWNFRDGSTSTSTNLIHQFALPGNYSVRLNVTDNTGKVDSTQKWVNVTGLWHMVTFDTLRSTCSLLAGGNISFIVRGSGSSIVVNNSFLNLTDGDRVKVTLRSSLTEGKITMAGEITELNLTNISLMVNDYLVSEGNCTNIRITDLQNFHSSLKLFAPRQPGVRINLIWDDVPTPIKTSEYFALYNLMPVNPQMMNLYLSKSQAYFYGNASGYLNTTTYS